MWGTLELLPTLTLQAHGFPAYAYSSGARIPCLRLLFRRTDSLPTLTLQVHGFPAYAYSSGARIPCLRLLFRRTDSLPTLTLQAHRFPATFILQDSSPTLLFRRPDPRFRLLFRPR
ncbi:hypothetical protein TNCT_548291 [Trichonephila clavata]|uniref:Uncharacterized protein n=1 Tax=Trichonephila clavata TaxID=2740835 RepID=A0A8X6F0C0_TRICU|nr:hypothetical protein TNCT_548291 [Trichonephila clavata]